MLLYLGFIAIGFRVRLLLDKYRLEISYLSYIIGKSDLLV